MSDTTRNPARRRAEWRDVQHSINPVAISLFGDEEAKLYNEMTAIEADLGPTHAAYALAVANLRAHDDATERANRMGEVPPPKADRDHLEHKGHQAAAALRVVQDELRRAQQRVADAYVNNHEDRASRAVPRVVALHSVRRSMRMRRPWFHIAPLAPSSTPQGEPPNERHPRSTGRRRRRPLRRSTGRVE